jgi:hypothetical protein
MEHFEADMFVQLLGVVEVISVTSSDSSDDALLAASSIANTSSVITRLLARLYPLNMTASIVTARRIMILLSSENPRKRSLHKQLEELIGRVRDELSGIVFLYLSSQEALYYDRPIDGWEIVIKRYRKIQRDIEEASKCLALNRATAAVLHLMRVVEVGLTTAAKVIGIPYAPSWESYLRQMQKQLDLDWTAKSPQMKKNEPYIREVYGLLSAVKVAWRNPTVHVKRTPYTLEEAREIYDAVRGFMRHLATKATRKRV